MDGTERERERERERELLLTISDYFPVTSATELDNNRHPIMNTAEILSERKINSKLKNELTDSTG